MKNYIPFFTHPYLLPSPPSFLPLFLALRRRCPSSGMCGVSFVPFLYPSLLFISPSLSSHQVPRKKRCMFSHRFLLLFLLLPLLPPLTHQIVRGLRQQQRLLSPARMGRPSLLLQRRYPRHGRRGPCGGSRCQARDGSLHPKG